MREFDPKLQFIKIPLENNSDNFTAKGEFVKQSQYHQDQNTKVSYDIFFWVVGGIGAITVLIISSILYYVFFLIHKIDDKYETKYATIENKYAIDHDKTLIMERDLTYHSKLPKHVQQK